MKPDEWKWVAYFADGTCVHEAIAQSFGNLPLEQVVAIELLGQRGKKVVVRIEVPEGKKAVFFRRHKRKVVLAEKSSKHEMFVCVGWEGNYQFWREDGTVLVSSNLQAV